MPVLDLIYVTTGRHPATERIIQLATGSKYSHAATRFEFNGAQVIVEAVRPVVQAVAGDYFEGSPYLQVVSIPITEEQAQAVAKRAFELVGKSYGVDDCFIGGSNDMLGGRVANSLDRFIDQQETFNCSSAQTEIIRAAFPWYAEGIDASLITPEQARLLAVNLQSIITGGVNCEP